MRLGIIGGSGIERLPGIDEWETLDIPSPFGPPSAPLKRARIEGTEIVFLARHGPGHRIPPHAIPYRANIDCLKRAGVTDAVSLSACGSLRHDLPPGTFVLVDQFIDRTRRVSSFFDEGLVAHVSMADPTCSRLRSMAADALRTLRIPFTPTGTYLAMEGPQFSTRAESRLYRGWGADVIGMTNMPEARLAREAELCYLTVAMVTDYDSWRVHEDGVDVTAILEILATNREVAGRLVADLARRLGVCGRPEPCPAGCDRALDHAVITAPTARDPELRDRLDAILARWHGVQERKGAG
ncbi:MAG: S-methyl-5'-thioadenosine phosphorylase [Alphaproteobacteria bacterium]|nr:MAG: S-methyl-5'-thioadenosine phosphorylase [Alphaproteobacteria bacterium]